jgi:large subunit ribosomal protein L2
MNFNPFKRLSNKQADLIFEKFKYEKYLKRLNFGNVKALGRSHGKITMSHKGGGVKRQYRSLSNYKKEELDFGIIRSKKYDPNRSSFIGLFQYSNGSFSNKVVSSKNSVGQIIKTYKDKTSFMK